MPQSVKAAKLAETLGLALILSLGTALTTALVARADSLTRMPVKEITVFKDGHALLIHEGLMSTASDGSVIVENLPRPVLGTFFPYSLDKNARLESVTAGRRKIDKEQTALTTAQLVAANIGALVHIDEMIGEGEKARLLSYDATIMAIPERTARELADEQGIDDSLLLPQKSELVQLKTENGISFIPISRIQTITFKSDPHKKLAEQDLRNVLTMNFKRKNDSSGKAHVGMMYVEKGIRWIPSYKVTIDGQGHAVVKLQATIVNDLTDLQDVSCNLVVGVPSFAFKGEEDPISLSQTLAHVAQNAMQDSRMRNNFSNAIMSQSAAPGYDQGEAGRVPEVSHEGSKSEDLFVFSLKNLSLKKGERMVLPVQQYTVDYKDLYCLDLAATPPPEVSQQYAGRSEEKAAELNKVMHKIRLFNSSKQPFTTAPALIVVARSGTKNDSEESTSNDEVLAQGMMTYASPGSNSDLTLTNAIDIKVKKDEREVERKPDAVTWQDNRYARVNLTGSVSLTNYSAKPVVIEITRKVLGRLDTASAGGQMKMVNTIDELGGVPAWWAHYSWPGWWAYMNGIGEFKWTRTIEAGKSIDVDYAWHYFWR
jgi:hypothetical protein